MHIYIIEEVGHVMRICLDRMIRHTFLQSQEVLKPSDKMRSIYFFFRRHTSDKTIPRSNDDHGDNFSGEVSINAILTSIVRHEG